VFSNLRALEVNVISNLKTVIQRYPILAIKIPKIEVILNEKAIVIAVLDTRVEVNIMSRAFANIAKLTIFKRRTITFSTISKKNIPIYTDFFIVAST
jgi:riboflavin biosynthesis pyrimidine reductase